MTIPADECISQRDPVLYKKGNGVYLELFNGRPGPDVVLEDWGSNGPVLGPFPYVQFMSGQTLFLGGEEQQLTVDVGLIYYGGVYYADWSLYSEAAISRMGAERKIEAFDEAQSIRPKRRKPRVKSSRPAAGDGGRARKPRRP